MQSPSISKAHDREGAYRYAEETGPHATEIESGQLLLKTCGLHDVTSLPLAVLLPVLPGPVVAEAAALKQPLPEDDSSPLAPAPATEVPTPPPLA